MPLSKEVAEEKRLRYSMPVAIKVQTPAAMWNPEGIASLRVTEPAVPWEDFRGKLEYSQLEIEENNFWAAFSPSSSASSLSLSTSSGSEGSPSCPWSSAMLPINQPKNRYTKFLPFDQSRVILEDQQQDYINASYIHTEETLSASSSSLSSSMEMEFHGDGYIACQAPIGGRTVDDFWQMIWQQNCGVVVMLTSVGEGQADPYWPQMEGELGRYGRYLVCHKKSFTLGEVIIRSLLVKEDDLRGSFTTAREIVQLQYCGWPDFGCPPSTKPIRDLLVLLSKFKGRAVTQHGLEGPPVIHCSAGVGRTGVLIAAHMVLVGLIEDREMDIKRTVATMRKQRFGMVRTCSQYCLIGAVVRDAIKTNLLKEMAECSASSLRHSSDARFRHC